LVALAGIGVYLVRHGRAVQPATTQNPVRFRGIGQNPNTVAMLLAVALPLAALLGLEARTRARRLGAAAAFLLLWGSIVASGSRRAPPGGRLDAWRAGLHQGDGRPLLGYGFGTEDHVFVDRLYDFEGGTAENSFVGLFMQLGGAGLALFLLLVASLLLAGWRAVRRAADRGLAAACFAVLVLGLALAVVQSYVYSVGNTATMSIWICSFLPVAAASRG